MIELLISLIIISLFITALAPVLTKKLKYQNATISSSSPSLDCTKFDAQARCLMCNKTCTLCTTQLEQLEGKYVYPPEGCDYKDCSGGCKKCDFKGCISCYEGYGFNSDAKTCSKCRSGEYSLGGVEVCKKCPINCIACKDETKCTACRECII